MSKVSILVPLYETNSEHLKQMISSVLEQSFKDFELVLLNDSPWNKELYKIISEFKDRRIIYIENEKNLGISESRNKLIELSSSEYIAILDHDDICERNRLELQVDFLNKHQEIGVVSGGNIEIPSNRITLYPETNEEIKKHLLDGCCVLHPAAMIRRKVLIENNIRYEKNFTPAEDYKLWVSLIDKTMFYNLPIPVIKYRNHQGNTSHRLAESMRDKDLLIKSEALRKFPYYTVEYKRKTWLYLFGLIPIVKVKKESDSKKYLLFGIINILTRR